MASFFDDLGGSFDSGTGFGTTASGAATGALIGSLVLPGVGTAVGAAIGAGVGAAGGAIAQRQVRKAAQRAKDVKEQKRKEAIQSRNELVEQSFRRRSQSRSGGQGGIGLSPGQQNASTKGTSLLSDSGNTTPSLFNT